MLFFSFKRSCFLSNENHLSAGEVDESKLLSNSKTDTHGRDYKRHWVLRTVRGLVGRVSKVVVYFCLPNDLIDFIPNLNARIFLSSKINI